MVASSYLFSRSQVALFKFTGKKKKKNKANNFSVVLLSKSVMLYGLVAALFSFLKCTYGNFHSRSCKIKQNLKTTVIMTAILSSNPP